VGKAAAPDAPGDLAEADGGAPATGARVIVIDGSSQLIGGREALGDMGDFLLVNEQVRFIVRAKEKGLYNPYSASLVDADLVRPKGEPGNDRFFELFPLVGLIRACCPCRPPMVLRQDKPGPGG